MATLAPESLALVHVLCRGRHLPPAIATFLATFLDTTRRPVVIDSGGSCTRAGLAAAAAAAGAGATAAAAARGLEQLCVFPTLVGRRKTTGMALMGGVGKGASACVAPTTPGGGKARAVFVGHDARRKRGMLTVKAPLEKGLIVDWDAMEKVWHHAFFQELRIDPREHPVLLTERPLQPKESRERVCQVLFDLFQVDGYYVVLCSKLALIASGLTTGLVLDSGHGRTDIVPHFMGFALPHATVQLDLAGRDVTTFLDRLLTDEREWYAEDFIADQIGRARRDVCREVKETTAFVALDYEAALLEATSASATAATPGLVAAAAADDDDDAVATAADAADDMHPAVPQQEGHGLATEVDFLIAAGGSVGRSGRSGGSVTPGAARAASPPPMEGSSGAASAAASGVTVQVGSERFRCAEILFSPSVGGLECSGVHEAVCASIGACDDELKEDLYSAIVVCGGNTLFPGFAQRLVKEIKGLAGDEWAGAVDVRAPASRAHSVWIGGSMLASTLSMGGEEENAWITADEYAESGPGVVMMKCF